MRPALFFYLIALLALSGCSADEVVCTALQQEPTLIIKGTTCHSFKSRSSGTGENALPDGSVISFYASGGLSASNEKLTLSRGTWTGNTPFEWNDNEKTVSFSAFYPALTDDDTEYYAADGTLTDILYDRQEKISSGQLKLNFKHLFSQIEFQVDEALNKDIERIEFTPSKIVEQIHKTDLNITFSTAGLKTATIPREENGAYTLIIPPASDMGIQIAIHMSTGEVKEALLSNRTFEQGRSYRCAVKSDSGAPGIYTVDDFIAFSCLINEESYPDRTLDEFGSLENGIMTYRLKNDLSFTTEQSKEVRLIGNSTSGFSGCFDGEGHTVYNLSFSTQEKVSYRGIFVRVSSNGIIQNLNLENIQYTHSTGEEYIGILSGINLGVVNNCHIKNCQMTAKGTKKVAYNAGSLSSTNKGIIYNSSCENNTFSGAYCYVGGLVNTNNGGKLINCYTVNTSFSKCQRGSSMADADSKGEVYNCYAASNTYSKTGTFIYKAGTSNITNCFIDEAEGNTITSSSGTQADIQTFNSTTRPNVLSSLNNWIKNNGATLFPDYTFFTWEESEDIPFILVRN